MNNNYNNLVFKDILSANQYKNKARMLILGTISLVSSKE